MDDLEGSRSGIASTLGVDVSSCVWTHDSLTNIGLYVRLSVLRPGIESRGPSLIYSLSSHAKEVLRNKPVGWPMLAIQLCDKSPSGGRL